MVPAVASPGLGIALPQTLEVRARRVVEQDVEGLLEEGSDPRLEVSLQGGLVRQEMVERPVESVLVHPLLVHPADVLQRRPRVEAFLERQLR